MKTKKKGDKYSQNNFAKNLTAVKTERMFARSCHNKRTLIAEVNRKPNFFTRLENKFVASCARYLESCLDSFCKHSEQPFATPGKQTLSVLSRRGKKLEWKKQNVDRKGKTTPEIIAVDTQLKKKKKDRKSRH